MTEINMNNLPPEIAAYVKLLEKENTSLKSKIEKQAIQIQNMNEMLVQGRKMMFGKSSEQLKYIDDAEQISFFNEAEKEYNSAAPEPTEELTENLLIMRLFASLTTKIALNARRKRTRLKLSRRLPLFLQ